jgi:excinuclease ABC subunit A
VIKCADRLIDLGPEGGDEGGLLIATGTPEEVAAVGESHTGRFLEPLVGAPRARPRSRARKPVARAARAAAA